MLDEVLIREIVSGDDQSLSIFLGKNNVKEIRRHFNPFPLTKETAYRISNVDQFNKYYISIYSEKIIGLGMLRGWDEGFLIPSLGLLIDKDFQGMGLGKLMLAYLLDEAKRLGCPRIRLTVYVNNEKAVNLYKSAGFVEVSRASVYINEEEDIQIVMYKELEI